MVFSTGCEPDVDWSLCGEETGYPRVLPAFYIVSAVLYGLTAVLYTVSMVRTLRLQLKEKKKMSYNTAVQMHAGIVFFSVATFIHGVSLASPEPGIPAVPLLLLLHARYICVGYATTILVRHWAVLYQQMGKNQQTEGQLTEGIARFVELYRDGEVIQAVVTCSFFFGSVVYGVTNENNWDQVERLQFLVWAILSGTTCWLVSVLGQRVHANMKRVARSRAVLDYLKRVKYVVIGSSLLWCQCTVCFSIGAALERPLSARAWLFCHSGITLTGVGTGSLYYVVIGSKIAYNTANAVEVSHLPAEGVKQVQLKFKALAKLVSSGASHFIEGVSTIASMGDSSARVHMNDNSSDEHKSYRRIASGRRWSISRRRADTGASPTLSMRASGAGWAPGSGAGEIGDSFATKLTMPDVLDEEVGLFVGDVGDRGRFEEKRQDEPSWESPISPMMPETPPQGGSTAVDTTTEGDGAHGGEEDSRDQQSPASRRKRSRQSPVRNTSSNDHATASDEPPSADGEESWKIEELDNHLSSNNSHDVASDHSRSSWHRSSRSQSDHGSPTGTGGHSETDCGCHSSDSRSRDSDTWRSRASSSTSRKG